MANKSLKLKSGVTINREDPRVKDAKTIEDIQNLHIFNHLSDDAKKEAEEELLAELEANPLEEEVKEDVKEEEKGEDQE